MFLQSKLHNNSILTGSVDSYCLVCDNYLRSEDEAYTHTEKPIHKKNMGAATRLEKFKNDQIIKVKKGYYCSYCNILLSTTTKVGLHINETKHQENKGAQILNRVGDNIIAFDEVAISWEAWHGIVDNTCLICNTEFDKADEHRRDQCHILKLIQSKLEFGDKYMYREVDGDSFYCLICWNVFSIEYKPDHHEDIKHKTLYNAGIELKNKTSDVPVIKGYATSENPIQSKNVNGSKNNNLTDITEKHTTNAGSANNTKASPKSTDAAPKKGNGKVTDTFNPVDGTNTNATAKTVDPKKMNTMDTAKSVDSKKINAMDSAKSVDAKKINAMGTTKSTDAKKFGLEHRRKIQIIVHDNNSANEPVSNTQKAEDFIDIASKVLDPNKDLRMREYLDVNNYIVNEEENLKRCVICDVINIRTEDVLDHISNDLHHQIILQKHRETLLKKVGSKVKINEKSQSSDGNIIKKGGKIYLKNSENAAVRNAKPHQELKLELFPPLDVQSKIRRQNPDSDISSDEDEEMSKILDNVDKYQHNDININFTSEKAHCKRCDEYVPLDFVALEEHVRDRHGQKDYQTLNREINLQEKIRSFAGINYMVVSENEAYCKLCSCTLALNLEVMKGHANTSSHKSKVAINDISPENKVMSAKLINVIYRVEQNHGSHIVLNNSHLLPYLSFHIVGVEGDDYLCVLCAFKFPKDSAAQLSEHLNLFEHKQKLGLCNVVTCFSDEFIREITPGEYHCGYCNSFTKSWMEMEDHIVTRPHKNLRRDCQWSLKRCIIAIRNSRPQQVSTLHAVKFS